MTNEFADIVFPATIDKPFTYRIPPELAELAAPGSRVIAPFGTRRLTGFIINMKPESDAPVPKIKFIDDIPDTTPIVSPELFQLAQWISEYYVCPLADVLKAALPSALFQVSKAHVKVSVNDPETKAAEIESRAPRQAQILRYLSRAGNVKIDYLKRKIGARTLLSSINQLQTRGWLEVEQILPGLRAKPRLQKLIYLRNNSPQDPEGELRLGAKQRTCLQFLRKQHSAVALDALLKGSGVSSTTVSSLEKRGLITVTTKELFRDYYGDIDPPVATQVTLNPEQRQALDHIAGCVEADQFRTFLLHGVTGSGKTQVYIDAIHKVLARGRDAIVLVPEISLTPQTVQRFRAHFKQQVAVLHSGMSDGERYDSWRSLREGRTKVVIGPRSAVFAPVGNLGLVVVDEEHEDSYKQVDPAPRYHARDVAVVRAKLAGAVVVLGSATPSAESYHNALAEKYTLLQLKNRIDHVPMPSVEIVDMLKERRLSGTGQVPIFCRLLVRKVKEKLERNEQIILLLNRRGFSSYIKCKDCGYVATCKNCDISLTYHLRGGHLRCHYCGFTRKAPEVCPDCRSQDIIFRGYGTQRVEEAIKEVFPEGRVVRMDLDTTSEKRSHDRILKDFGDGKYNILLGTQMIAKGLDFQRVTLVGVINADVGLLIPDFRSTERTFQLLTQVAGRAGRKNLPGEVVVQTFSPNEFCLRCAEKHDFESFFAGEVMTRRELLYPPFGRLISVLFKGKDEELVIKASKKYGHVIRELKEQIQVLGPTPSPIVRIQNKYRWHILLKVDKRQDAGGKALRRAVRKAEELYLDEYRTRGVQISVDADPIGLI